MLVNATSTEPYFPSSLRPKPEMAQKSSSLSYQDVETQASGLTDKAQFSISSQISDLSFSQDQTSFAYYKQDNSIALRAESQTNVNLHEETYNYNIAYSAEALGLTAKDFANNKPMVLSFSFQQKEISIESQISMQVVNRVRDPQDVLNDLANALRDVLRDNGNKSVSYILDGAARQSLLSDPKITRLVNELILLMASINLSKKQGSGKHYTINISGKAKPMVETQEKTNVNGITRTVNFSITINPPAQQNPAAAAPAPAVETPQAKAQPANLNVAV